MGATALPGGACEASLAERAHDFAMASDDSSCSRPSAGSELHAHAAIDIAAVQGCPRVNRPAAIDTARWTQQGIPLGLLDVTEVLAVDEQARVAEPLLDQGAEEHVRTTCLSIGIRLEALLAGVVPLEAQPAHVLGFPQTREGDVVRGVPLTA